MACCVQRLFFFQLKTIFKRKKDKKRKLLSHAGVEKMQGRSAAKLCIILAFLWCVSPVWSPHTFADLFCGFFFRENSGQERVYLT